MPVEIVEVTRQSEQTVMVDRPEIAYSIVGSILFPFTQNRNVIMLPFVTGRLESLPSLL